MKVIVISDTHNRHADLDLPKGDMIVHAGDVSMKGKQEEISDFLDWFGSLDFRHKIFIAGNHDFYFERTPLEIIQEQIPNGVIYLEDCGVKINDIHIWGSPVQPWFFQWAFNRNRGADIRKHWDLIPDNTDILITHGPPWDILDKTVHNEKVGCDDLLNRVLEIKPKFHLFGHVHEGYGWEVKEDITFINASVLNYSNYLTNKPVQFEFKTKTPLST